MNIYARYFDHEVVVPNLDELFQFLDSLRDVVVDKQLVQDITAYYNSDITYPKRYKLRPKVYFILIKTTAQSLEEFKANNKHPENGESPAFVPADSFGQKDARMLILEEQREGWYFGRIHFKRVTLIPGTQKFRYSDCDFSAYVRANSGKDCYQRIIEHLKNRQDVDPRSQLPSAKGNNFTFEYVGEQVPVKGA